MECIRGVEIEQVISAARALSDQLLPAAGSKDS
jgi:hypothetical protein